MGLQIGCRYALEQMTCSSAWHVGGGSEGAEGSGEGGNSETEAPFPPKVCWYDARHRVALKRVALWLNVPWSKVVPFYLISATSRCSTCFT